MVLPSVASIGGGGPLRVTPYRDVTPERNLILVAEFRKNTGQTTLEGGEGGSGNDIAKKSSVFGGR